MDINWTTPPPAARAGLKERNGNMKLMHEGREIEVHPTVDVPKLVAVHSLAWANLGEAFTFRPMRGEPLQLRFQEADLLLRQVVDAA